MKNIQIIDGARNSTFDIYSISDSLFRRLFPKGTDIAVAEDFPEMLPGLEKLFACPIRKKDVRGIHGTLHLEGSQAEPRCFKSRRESRVRENPELLRRPKDLTHRTLNASKKSKDVKCFATKEEIYTDLGM